MMAFLIVFLAGALGALFYRARGGFNPASFGTTGTRLAFWGAPMGCAAGLIALAHGAGLDALLVAAVAALMAYVGLLESQGAAADNSPALADALQMAQIGAMRAAGIALPLATVTRLALILPLFGALSGLAYWAGWRFLDGHDSGIHWWGKTFARGGSEWGEVLTGAALGLGLGIVGVLA